MVFTQSQRQAIDYQGGSILVSAGAGSGKTAVLVNRVIRKITDSNNPVDIDRLLILTYTKAAAQKMRQKIAAALYEKLNNEPENPVILRQVSLLENVKIGTIHSACLEFIRQNFEALGIDPMFNVADPQDIEAIKQAELELFLDELYEKACSAQNIAEFLDYFAGGRDDKSLMDAVIYGSDFLSGQPFYKDFISRTLSRMQSGDIFERFSDDLLYNYLNEELADIQNGYTKLIERANQNGVLALGDFYAQEKDKLENLTVALQNRDFNLLVDIMQSFKFSNHPAKGKGALKGVPAELCDFLKTQRELLKAKVLQLRGSILNKDEAGQISDFNRQAGFLKTYFEVTGDFFERFSARRSRERLVSFEDIERLALKLLIKNYDYEKDTIEKTDAAKALSEQFDEIMVDEFQDTNKVQDLIFRALSKSEQNIFMVGDIKQSIYRFRRAMPEIFIQKSTAAKKGKLYSVNLSDNFRSDGAVISFINSLFEKLMTSSFGEVEYDQSQKMIAANNANSKDDAVLFELVAYDDSNEDDENAPTKIEAEAKYVALRIKQMVDSGQMIYDTAAGRMRRLEYGDFAILTRNAKGVAEHFEKELKALNIGVVNNNPSEKYLDTAEVKSVLAYLESINNPYDDLSLITLMHSRFFGFDAKSLAKIRIAAGKSPFYDGVKALSQTDKKCREFVKQLDNMRTYSLTMSVYEIISRIYEQSGILISLSALPDGALMCANLELLADLARDFESEAYRGLFSFIQYINELIKKDAIIPGAKLNHGKSQVQILSIHKSKGLEFEVCFVVNANKSIRFDDNGPVILHTDYGASAQIRDYEKYEVYDPINRSIMIALDRQKTLSEELRILYVALTRAKSKLIITAAAGQKEQEVLLNAEGLAYNKSPSFARWIAASGVIKPALCSFKGISQTALDERLKQSHTIDFEKAKKLLDYVYPYNAVIGVPAKLSVSEIKGMRESEPDSDKLFEKQPQFKKPRFLDNRISSGREAGDALHKFLQFANFEKLETLEGIKDELVRLVKDSFLLSKQAELVDTAAVLKFAQSDIFKRLIASGNYQKEKRFLFNIAADKLFKGAENENILVQGVLDCFFLEKDGAVILDYKTDHLKSESEFIDRYALQLKLYKQALGQQNIKVKQLYIYSFYLGKTLAVD